VTAVVVSTGAEELHVLTSTVLGGIAAKVEVVSMELLLSLVLLWGEFRHWLGSCCRLLAIGIAVVVMAVVILANVGAIFSMGAAVYSCWCKRQMNKQTTQSTCFLLGWWSYGCRSIIWHHQGGSRCLPDGRST